MDDGSVDWLPEVQLDGYAGPLDVLLDLIRKQEIDIFNIPIARITQQYLDYLHQREEMNLDIAGEFILMAVTLIQIKARMLLPVDPDAPADSLEDPRTDLIQRLLEHEKFKNAALMLAERQLLEQASWSRPDVSAFGDEQGGLVVTLWDLAKAFREVLERPPAPAPYEVQREDISVAEMMEEVRRQLQQADGPVALLEFCRRYPTRRGLITLFLALLELVRLEAIIAVQQETFGPILLRKHKMFDIVFGAGIAAQVDEQYQ